MTPPALHARNPSPRVSTHLITFAPASLPETFKTYYKTDESIQLFTPSIGKFGFTTPYVGLREFALYGTKEDLDAATEGKKQNPPVASATLPDKSNLVLLLCTRAANDKVTLAAHDVDSDDLKLGTYRVFNLSKSIISVTMGDQIFEMTPGKNTIVRDSKWHDKPIALSINISTVVEGNATPVYSSLMEPYPQSRKLIFLFDGTDPSDPITYATLDADNAPQKTTPFKGASKRSKP